MSRNLRPLIEAGWLILNKGIDDRSRLISITMQGREKLVEADIFWNNTQSKTQTMFGGELTDALFSMLDAALVKIQTNRSNASD